MHVLHVEDDPSLARAVERMLRISYDAITVTAESARDAIALLEAGGHDGCGYDLIISDYDLRGDTGADLIAWLREHDPDMLDHTFMLCANERAESLGVPVVTKPAPNSEIRAMVERRALNLQGK